MQNTQMTQPEEILDTDLDAATGGADRVRARAPKPTTTGTSLIAPDMILSAGYCIDLDSGS
ncbi:MAG: hypothetical protein AAGC81_20280 [Pseudomonadota bacterium]